MGTYPSPTIEFQITPLEVQMVLDADLAARAVKNTKDLHTEIPSTY